MGEALFLASVYKGLENFPRPLFWAVIYGVFLLTYEHLWSLGSGDWRHPLMWVLTDTALAYAYFRALLVGGDGWLYWSIFSAGFLVFVFLLP